VQIALQISEQNLETIDRKITAYLASLAGKNEFRFCAPKIESIRFAAAWAMPDEFVEQRLAHLVDVGRITRATVEIKGNAVDGFIVLPNRLYKSRPASSELELTVEDAEFLRAVGVLVEGQSSAE
jgi:hypothetical protein